MLVVEFLRFKKLPFGFIHKRFLTSKSEHEASESSTTHFGFETIKKNEKSKKVHKVFETVANSYDIMNDAMSFGIHRIWKDIFIQRLSPTQGTTLLDVAGGTGDIALRYLKFLEKLPVAKDVVGKVTICDINQSMLDAGKLRFMQLKHINPDQIEWICADAENLPIESSTYSAYTIAFGIRNVTNIDKVLDQAYRVLKPGGRFLCLEFSHVNNEVLQWLYDYYSFQAIPVMGHVITGEWKAYQYLVESIRKFPNQEVFKGMIEAAGFSAVTYENLTFGVVAIHSGFKL